MSAQAHTEKGYSASPAHAACEHLYGDLRFGLHKVYDIENIVNAALLMVERGALTPAKARAVLTPTEAKIFDRARELAA
jgi:hypothetical protein